MGTVANIWRNRPVLSSGLFSNSNNAYKNFCGLCWVRLFLGCVDRLARIMGNSKFAVKNS